MGRRRGADRPARPSDLVRGAPVVYLLITGIVYTTLLLALDWLLNPPRGRSAFP